MYFVILTAIERINLLTYYYQLRDYDFDVNYTAGENESYNSTAMCQYYLLS